MRATALVMFGFLSFFPAAWAHDMAGESDWVRDKGLVDPLSGAHCCGPNDCSPMPDDSVAETKDGYLLKDTGEVIPYNKAIPKSPDGRFWRCRMYSEGAIKARCFIIPPPNS